MTAQKMEVITVSGKVHKLATCPLEAYFQDRAQKPDFLIPSTSLWRGYLGSWVIEGGKLYLTGIEAKFSNGTIVRLEDIFPGSIGPVFADWFTGRLRMPDGKLVNYVHGGFGSTFERDLIASVDAGVITKYRTKKNWWLVRLIGRLRR